MMSNKGLVVALFLVCLATCFTYTHSMARCVTSSDDHEDQQWTPQRSYPCLHPRFPRSHVHPMALQPLEPKVKNCFSAFDDDEGRTCMHEIYHAFWARKHSFISLKPDCCQAIQEFDKYCASTVFARFEDPSLHHILKKYCAQISQSHLLSSSASEPSLLSPPESCSGEL